MYDINCETNKNLCMQNLFYLKILDLCLLYIEFSFKKVWEMEFSSHLLLLIFYDFALDIFFQILQHQKLCSLKVTRVFSLHIISQKKLVKIFGRKNSWTQNGLVLLSYILHFIFTRKKWDFLNSVSKHSKTDQDSHYVITRCRLLQWLVTMLLWS